MQDGAPKHRPEVLPKIEFGGVNQPRNIIFRVDRSMSPFKNFRSEGIDPNPHNSTPEEFLEDWCALSCRSVTG